MSQTRAQVHAKVQQMYVESYQDASIDENIVRARVEHLQLALDELSVSRNFWIDDDFIIAARILHDIATLAHDDLRDRLLRSVADEKLNEIYQSRPDIDNLAYQCRALLVCQSEFHQQVVKLENIEGGDAVLIGSEYERAAMSYQRLKARLSRIPASNDARWLTIEINQDNDADYLRMIVGLSYFDLGRYDALLGNKQLALLQFNKGVDYVRGADDDQKNAAADNLRCLYSNMSEVTQFDKPMDRLARYGKCMAGEIFVDDLSFSELCLIRNFLVINLDYENLYKLELFEQLLAVLQELYETKRLSEDVPIYHELQRNEVMERFLAMRAEIITIRQSFYKSHEREPDNIILASRMMALNARLVKLQHTTTQLITTKDHAMTKHTINSLLKQLATLSNTSYELLLLIDRNIAVKASRKHTGAELLADMKKTLAELPAVDDPVWNELHEKQRGDLLKSMLGVVDYYRCMGDFDESLQMIMRAVSYLPFYGTGDESYHALKTIYHTMEKTFGDLGDSDPLLVAMYEVVMNIILSKDSEIKDVMRGLGLLRSTFQENIRVENISKFELMNQFLQLLHDKLENGLLDKYANGHYVQKFPGTAFRKAMEVPFMRNHFESVYQDIRKMSVSLSGLANHVPFKAAMLEGLGDLEQRVQKLEEAADAQEHVAAPRGKRTAKNPRVTKVKSTMYAKREPQQEVVNERPTRRHRK